MLLGVMTIIPKTLKSSKKELDLFLDLEVPDLPYEVPVTYRDYEQMRTYFVQKYMDSYLNKEEDNNHGK